MQRLTPAPASSPANVLEQLAEQAGGCYHLVTLTCVLERNSSVLVVTFVNHNSPGGVQDWTMLNGSESVEGSVVINDQCVVCAFSTEDGIFSNPSAGSYIEHLLQRGMWYGAAAPYYAD